MANNKTITGIKLDSAIDNGKYIKYNSATDVFVMDTPASGGAPGGSTTQLQYNNAGAFGGARVYYSASGNSANLIVGDATFPDSYLGGVNSTGTAGAFSLLSGNSTSAGNGGALQFFSGYATSGDGGNINFTAGSGGTNGNGGNVTITAGAGAGTGTAGNITLNGFRFNQTEGIFMEQSTYDTAIWGYAGPTNTGFDMTVYSGSNNIVLGNTGGLPNATSATNNILIGQSGAILSSGNDNILIGASANLSAGTDVGAIAIGRSATAGSNECVIGGNNTSGFISEVYFGRGKTSATARDVTIQIGGRSGTNLAANTVSWASGKGTGNSTTGGLHLFKTPDTGSSGTTLQGLSTKAQISRTGVFSIRSGLTTVDTKYANVGGRIKEFYTDAGNSTTAVTTLYTYTIEGNTLGANGDSVEADYGGIFVSSGTATRQLTVSFYGNIIFDTGALTITTNSSWTISATIIRVSSTSVRYMVSLTTQGATLSAYTAVGALTGLTLSAADAILIQGTAAGAGAATNDIVAKLGTVYWYPASV